MKTSCRKPSTGLEVNSLRSAMLERLCSQRSHFVSFVRSRVADSSRAEDILQTAFARAIESGSKLRDTQRADAWFYRILRNLLVDEHRKASAAREEIGLESPESVPARESQELRICSCAGHALQELKAEYGNILRLVAVQEMPVQTYASSHGISATNASVRLHRARKALRSRLEEVCQDCAPAGCFDCACA
jgi:RNA polymerase sigma-70 factor (ECF subfamily)